MGRRRDRTSEAVEGLVKLVIIAAMFIAITVGGVKNFNTVFASLMSAVVFLAIGLIVIGACIAFAVILVKRRKRLGITGAEESLTNPVAPTPAPQIEQTISEKLRELDWFQFEKITATVMRARGYAVERRGGAKADGGIDLIARKGDETVAVQCKHWQAWDVGVKTTREFLGAMIHAQISKGIVVTLKGYTGEARDLAKHRDIE